MIFQALILSGIMILLKPRSTMQNTCDILFYFEKSWQSSSFAHLNSNIFCGIGNRGSPGFLHTAVGSAPTDQGYHWIALKLANPAVIATVVTRSGGFNGTNETFQRRTKGVEVWTSAKDIDFGDESCSSRSISSVFSSTRDMWRWCGRNSLRINSDVFHAQCTVIHKVRMILLRNYVANISAIEEQSLSFNDIFLIQANVTAEIQPSGQVIQNSNVKLRCKIVCADNITEFASRVRLCHSDSTLKCHASGSEAYHIANVQPSHSGTYSCMVGDEVLSFVKLKVLSPPSQLNISVITDGCNAKSPQIRIQFESSASHPAPHHQCTAFDDLNANLLEQNQAVRYENSNSQSRLSFWTCSRCTVIGNLSVKCTAVQKCNSSTAQLDCSTLKHGVFWTSSVEKLLKWNCSSEPHVVKKGSYVIQIAVPTIALVIIVLAAAIVVAKQKITNGSHFHQTTTSSNRKPDARNPPIELSTHQTPPSATAPTQENVVISQAVRSPNPEGCIYATVMNGDTSTLGLRLTRVDSVRTLYLDIVADGPEEADAAESVA